MFATRILLLCLACFTACIGRAEETALYVATNGNDTAAGTIGSPFATLTQARDVIRMRKAKGPLAGPVTVFVRGGVYELTETLKLEQRDSGTGATPIVFRAYAHETPVLTVAHAISGFAPYKGNIVKADVAAQGLRGVYFRQLFVDGKRLPLARYPNFDETNPYGGGWAYVDGKPVPMSQTIDGENRHSYHYAPKDARNWETPGTAEVFVFPRYNWANNIVSIKSINPATREVTLASDCSYAIRPGDRYYVRNLLDELDAPGEWYLDQQTSTLYYWPPPESKNPVVYAPRLRTIIEFGTGTGYVTFQGFTIQYFEGTAISMRGASHCMVTANTIRNGGDFRSSAVEVVGGDTNGVAGNDIFDIGGNGIVISGGDRVALSSAGNYADNNYIHHTGVFNKATAGIVLNGVGNRASHNLIHDTPRMAILFSGNNLTIEYNHVRHANVETADTGMIYTGGRDWISSRGSVIRFNYLHDSLGYGLEGGRWVSPHLTWGIYLDDNTGGVDVVSNLIARADRGLIHLHNGRDNLIQNNIFVDGNLQQAEFNGWRSKDSMWTSFLPKMIEGYNSVKNQPAWKKMRNMNIGPEQAVQSDGLIMSGNVFQRNILYWRRQGAKLFSLRNVPLDRNTWDQNLYWVQGSSPRIDGGGALGEFDWDGWRGRGQDQHSLVTDPFFVDAGNGNYQLRSNSPAFGLGFQQIPVDRIGPYRDPLRASWPITEAPGVRERPISGNK
jgi:hypothetical protein